MNNNSVSRYIPRHEVFPSGAFQHAPPLQTTRSGDYVRSKRSPGLSQRRVSNDEDRMARLHGSIHSQTFQSPHQLSRTSDAPENQKLSQRLHAVKTGGSQPYEPPQRQRNNSWGSLEGSMTFSDHSVLNEEFIPSLDDSEISMDFSTDSYFKNSSLDRSRRSLPDMRHDRKSWIRPRSDPYSYGQIPSKLQSRRGDIGVEIAMRRSITQNPECKNDHELNVALVLSRQEYIEQVTVERLEDERVLEMALSLSKIDF